MKQIRLLLTKKLTNSLRPNLYSEHTRVRRCRVENAPKRVGMCKDGAGGSELLRGKYQPYRESNWSLSI